MLNRLIIDHVEKINRVNYFEVEKYFNDNHLNIHCYFCLTRGIFNIDLFFEDFPIIDYPYFYL